MTDKTTQTGTTEAQPKSLSDSDIATFTRRPGPASGAPGSDVDTHSDVDTAIPAAHGDAATDKDN